MPTYIEASGEERRIEKRWHPGWDPIVPQEVIYVSFSDMKQKELLLLLLLLLFSVYYFE